MPTPKVPRRKSTIQDAMVSHLAELNDASQLSDSESKYVLSINVIMQYLYSFITSSPTIWSCKCKFF